MTHAGVDTHTVYLLGSFLDGSICWGSILGCIYGVEAPKRYGTQLDAAIKEATQQEDSMSIHLVLNTMYLLHGGCCHLGQYP